MLLLLLMGLWCTLIVDLIVIGIQTIGIVFIFPICGRIITVILMQNCWNSSGVHVIGFCGAIVTLYVLFEATYNCGITFHKQIFLVVEFSGWYNSCWPIDMVMMLLMKFVGIRFVKGIVDNRDGIGAQ